ncbi:hypothetical protein HK098_006764 [Nowakowskiella sp. JEL0407]|nr:hypothetical protein HK098_006764 [Nowakowskiella sp. JEL0407]
MSESHILRISNHRHRKKSKEAEASTNHEEIVNNALRHFNSLQSALCSNTIPKAIIHQRVERHPLNSPQNESKLSPRQSGTRHGRLNSAVSQNLSDGLVSPHTNEQLLAIKVKQLQSLLKEVSLQSAKQAEEIEGLKHALCEPEDNRPLRKQKNQSEKIYSKTEPPLSVDDIQSDTTNNPPTDNSIFISVNKIPRIPSEFPPESRFVRRNSSASNVSITHHSPRFSIQSLQPQKHLIPLPSKKESLDVDHRNWLYHDPKMKSTRKANLPPIHIAKEKEQYVAEIDIPVKPTTPVLTPLFYSEIINEISEAEKKMYQERIAKVESERDALEVELLSSYRQLRLIREKTAKALKRAVSGLQDVKRGFLRQDDDDIEMSQRQRAKPTKKPGRRVTHYWLPPNDASQPSEDGIIVEDDRTGVSITTLKRAIADNLFYIVGRSPSLASMNDLYLALSYTVRDRLLHRFLASRAAIRNSPDARIVSYLSAEFLLGPHLGNNLLNLGITADIREACEALGLDLEELVETEIEPGLGNGGLGRLAACYLDSLATLEIPAIGYGIRYEFGIFSQTFSNGWQVENTDKWLRYGNPWEIARPEEAVQVKLGGHCEHWVDEQGRYRTNWIPMKSVVGVPYDTPILGYQVQTVNALRLWKAEAPESFDFAAFNHGDYMRAVHDKIVSENLTKVLYPNDESVEGKRLRLEQQYFFVACSLSHMISQFLTTFPDKSVVYFHERFAIQLNDTHPSIGVAELMRILVDDYLITWDEAWETTQKTFGYTNHTLLSEALERWPVALFSQSLPRHMEIIFEINQRFLSSLDPKWKDNAEMISRISLIDESGERYVRMANLAVLGSNMINGVAALHSELLKTTVLADFYKLYPERFTNVTNGVTPRRFMVLANPELSSLISDHIGGLWPKDLTLLRKLEAYADDPKFRAAWVDAKIHAKTVLSDTIMRVSGVSVDPAALFDVQVKRIHEYKRQHLNALHIITLYRQIKRDPKAADSMVPRVFIFSGKAAPGYFLAKLIIKLINSIAEVVNNDPDVKDKIKVVFLPNYSVKNAGKIYPAADLSEQISTAGKEASGTGNMKLSMNGALTIGTLDGANVEIREEVGAENFFLFGLTEDQVEKTKRAGYNPREYVVANPELKGCLDMMLDGTFTKHVLYVGEGPNRISKIVQEDEIDLFKPIVDNLTYSDPYLVLADYEDYIRVQKQVSEAFRNSEKWARMSILNVARMGKFSSDRSIAEYVEKIWRASKVSVDVGGYAASQSAIVRSSSFGKLAKSPAGSTGNLNE